MKMTEQQALELGKKVLNDIKFQYHKNKPLTARYDEAENNPRHPEVKHSWSVACTWFDEDWLDGRDRSAFLVLDDDTGKPVVLSVCTGGGGHCIIDVDDKGKYFIKSNY
jgi:hypothetical protein